MGNNVKNEVNREYLLKIHRTLTEKAVEVMKAKNHDYATDSDPFRNFRMFGGLGILVRLSDKLARLRSFEENGEFKVVDEALVDTIVDTINYAVIYYAFRWEQNGDGGEVAPNGDVILRRLEELNRGSMPRGICDCGAPAAYEWRRDDFAAYACEDCANREGYNTNNAYRITR